MAPRSLLRAGVAGALVLAACGGDEPTTAATTTTTSTPAAAPVVLSLGEEGLLADLLAIGVTPVAASANVVVDGGFVGLDGFDTSGIEALVSTEPNLEQLAAFGADVIVVPDFFAERLGEDVLAGLADEVVVVPGDDPAQQLLAAADAFDRRAEAEALLAELDAAVADGAAALAARPGGAPTVSVATVYPGPTVAAWVDGPIDVPGTLLALGVTLDPGADDVDGEEGGRLFLSNEQLGLFGAPVIVALQSTYVEGEAEAVADVEADPLWTALPAVASGDVVTVERLGYPGIAGRLRLVHDLVELLGGA